MRKIKNKKLKSTLSLLTVFALLFSFTACSAKTEQQASSDVSKTPAAQETAASDPSESAPMANEVPPSESGSDEPAPSTGEDDQPVAKSQVTYPIAGDNTLEMVVNLRNRSQAALNGQDFTAQMLYPNICEATGVTVEFISISEVVYDEQLNLLIVSQDYPDIFGSGIGSYDSDPISAIEDDVIIDFVDIAATYAPDYYALLESDSDFSDQIYNSDGSLCRITGRNIGRQTMGLYIRADWLDALSLDIPETISELTDVLRAMKAEHDTPMTLLMNNDLDDGLAGAFNHVTAGFNRQMLNFQQTAPSSGEVVCSWASEGFIQHMLLLRQYYAEGIISDDFLSISKENNNFESSYYGGKCAVFYDDCEVASPDYYSSRTSDPNFRVYVFNTPSNGDPFYTSAINESNPGLSSLYISTGCENPEVALQFLNYGFTEEGSTLIALGVQDLTYTVAEDGSVAYTDLILQGDQELILVNGWLPSAQQQRTLNMRYTSNEPVEAYEMWTEFAKASGDEMTLPVTLSLTSEETATVNLYRGDLCTFFSENTGKLILGEIDEAGYREALEQANSVGLDIVTSIYQTAYDRYLAEQ